MLILFLLGPSKVQEIPINVLDFKSKQTIIVHFEWGKKLDFTQRKFCNWRKGIARKINESLHDSDQWIVGSGISICGSNSRDVKPFGLAFYLLLFRDKR